MIKITSLKEQQTALPRQARVVALIPARGGSKRLPRKNIYPLLGKPLIAYAILACKKSKYIDRIFVSTEDGEIKKVAKKWGAKIIDRPHYLAEDHIWTQDVMKHAVLDLMEQGIKFDILARIQANSPMVETEKIDEGISKLVKYRLWEVSSFDKNGIQDAAIHILRRGVVFQNAISVYNGIVLTDYIDIHTKEDVERVEKIWGDKLRGKS